MSQPYLPIPVNTYLENTTVAVTATYFDLNDNPFLPAAVSWRVDDICTEVNIIPWTAITPNYANTVIVGSQYNGLVNSAAFREVHQALFQITDSVGNISFARGLFEIQRTIGTPSQQAAPAEVD